MKHSRLIFSTALGLMFALPTYGQNAGVGIGTNRATGTTGTTNIPNGTSSDANMGATGRGTSNDSMTEDSTASAARRNRPMGSGQIGTTGSRTNPGTNTGMGTMNNFGVGTGMGTGSSSTTGSGTSSTTGSGTTHTP